MQSLMASSIDKNNHPRREAWIDMLRVISCFAVIVIHTSGQTYQKFGSLPDAEWWLANVLNACSRCAVPLFVMISGATLKISDADAIGFYRKKAVRFLPVIFVWSVLYAAFDLIVLGMSPKEVISLVIGRGFTYQHLWYLSMYLGLLMFVPFLVRIRFSSASADSQWKILLIVGFIAISVDWGFEFACRVLDVNFVPWPRTFVEFIPYFLFGLLFADRGNLSFLKSSGVWLVFVLTLSLVANWLAVTHLNVVDDSMPLANRSILVAAVAVCVFLFVRERVWDSRVSRFLRTMAPACLGIYLIHPFFLWFIQRILRETEIEVLRGVMMPVTALILFLISYVTILCIRKIPLGKIIC